MTCQAWDGTCPSPPVDAVWIAHTCPQQSQETGQAILDAGLCQMHTIERFGHSILRRGKALVPPPLSPSDGTVDRR